MAAFLVQSQSEVVVKETMWFSNLKYSLSGPLQKKFADIWSRWSDFWLVTSVMFRYLFFGTTLSPLQFWNPESSETQFFSRVLPQTHLVAKPDLNWCEAVYHLFSPHGMNSHVSCYRVINVFAYRVPSENLLGFFIIYSICTILPF